LKLFENVTGSGFLHVMCSMGLVPEIKLMYDDVCTVYLL